MRILFAALIMAAACMAQEGPAVVPSQGPPVYAYTTLTFYDVNGNLIYLCKARSTQFMTDFARAGQLTNIVVSSNTATVTTSVAHGLQPGNQLSIAGSATTALNGSYTIVTVPSATTFTITTSGVGDATITDVKFLQTVAPRSNAGVWSIQKFTYNTNNQITLAQWAGGSTGGNTGASSSCDSRASLAYQ